MIKSLAILLSIAAAAYVLAEATSPVDAVTDSVDRTTDKVDSRIAELQKQLDELREQLLDKQGEVDSLKEQLAEKGGDADDAAGRRDFLRAEREHVETGDASDNTQDETVTVPGQGYYRTQRYGAFGRRVRRVWVPGQPVQMLRSEAEAGGYPILEDQPAMELYSQGNLTWYRST